MQDDDFPIRTLFLPTQRQPHVDNRISMLQKDISWLAIWIVLPINWGSPYLWGYGRWWFIPSGSYNPDDKT